MTIAFFWTGTTGYMAACWRALAAEPGVRLKLFVEVKRGGDTAYRHGDVLSGLDAEVRFDDEPLDRQALREKVAALAPDVMVVLGWRSELCRAAATDPAFAAIPKLFAFDMTFAFKLRKLLAPLVLRPYLRRFAGAVVPSARSAFYARYLGFRASKVSRGLIGLDTTLFAQAREKRLRLVSYPRQFLYVGRYTREKRIDVLLEAYRRYRGRVQKPWGLTCCGMGPEAALLKGAAGVTDEGFVQPGDMPALYARHGAFVMASEYDPWPLVVAEAAASGLPVVCTQACGSHVDFVRNFANGRVCPTNDAEALSDALVWIHSRSSELASRGAQGVELAAPFSKEAWAQQWVERCERVVNGRLAR